MNNKTYLVYLPSLACLLLAACGGRSLDGAPNERGMFFDASPVLELRDGGPSSDDGTTDDGTTDDGTTDDGTTDDGTTDDGTTDDGTTDDGTTDDGTTDDGPSMPPPDGTTTTPSGTITGPIATGLPPTGPVPPPAQTVPTPTSGPTSRPTNTPSGTVLPTSVPPPGTAVPPTMPTSVPTTRPTVTPTGPTTTPPPPTSMPTTTPTTTPPSDPPDGCKDERQSVSTNYCDYELTCDDDYVYSYCSKNGDRFQCYCSNNRRSFEWGLTGVTADQACGVIAEVCTSGDEPEFSGPTTCTTDYSSESRDYCEESEICGQAADLGNGVTLWSSEYQSAWCNSEGSNSWDCTCQANYSWHNYSLSGVSQPPCGTVKDLCAGVITPDFSGPATCTPESQSTTPTSCSIYQECVQTADLGGGVNAELSTYQSTSCTAGGADWSCQCATDNGQISFSAPPASSTLQTCVDATDLCSSVQDVEPTGPMTCANSGQSSGQGYCSLQLTCGQSATVDGVDISVDGQLYTSCYEQDPGQYFCDCYSGSNYDSFDFPSSATSWETCEAASLECQQRVTVQIGNSTGGIIGIPSPGPIGVEF